jgi:hypothetical protein
MFSKNVPCFLNVSNMLFCLCPQHPAREYDGPCQGDLTAGVRIPLGISIREYRCEKHGKGLFILRDGGR